MVKFEGAFGGTDPLVIIADGDTVTIPDADLLFSGDYSRSGTDLVVTGEGKSVIVADYFGDAGLPTLASPSGAVLLPDVVSTLAGPQAPGRYAQADDAQTDDAQTDDADAQEGIGRVVSLTGSATAQRTDGTVVDLAVDSRLAEDDVVETGSGSELGIVFDDGTVFNLNADARMVLNELVYEPGGSSNSMLFSVVQGVFAFVAGQVAPTGEMRIDTPVTTMGVRGTSCLGILEGVAVFRVIPDPVTNRVGACVLYSPGTDIILAVSDSLDSQWVFDAATGQLIEQPSDPAHEDIIQRLHDTFIRFAGVPTEQEDTQLAGESGGSGMQTQFALTGAEIATIVALAGGALGETETLGGDAPVTGPGDIGEPLSTPTDLVPPPQPAFLEIAAAAPGPVVNQPPVVDPPPAENSAPDASEDELGEGGAPLGDENAVVVIQAADLLANDSDPDGDVLTIIAVSATSALGATVTLNPDGTISYDPRGALDLASGEIASDSFTYTVSDGQGGTSEATATFTVAGAPDFGAVDDEVETLEDTPATFNVLANDSGSEALSVVNVGTLSDPELGTLQDLGGGAFEFTPGLNASGTTSFTYQVSDGVNVSEATVTIVVEAVADAPALAVGDSESLDGGDFSTWSRLGQVSIVEAHEGQVPPDGGLMVLLSSTGVSDAEIEALLGLGAGTLDGVSNNDVTEGAVVTTELQVVAGDVISFDWNFGENDYLPYRDFAFVTVDGELFKLAEVNDSTQDVEWRGWQTFSFTVETTGTVTLGIGVVDDGDTVVDSELLIANLRSASGQVEGAVNTAIPLPIAASLVDNDGSETLSILVAGVPDGAVLSAGTDNGDGTWSLTPEQLSGLTITPPADSAADFTLTVTATAAEDANGDTASTTRTLDVLVSDGNQPPVAAADSFATTEDAAVEGNVLANDSDAEEHPLTVTRVNGSTANVGTQIALASGALLVLNADGSFAYDPNGQFDSLGPEDTAEDTFSYTISDGNGGTDTATVTITIGGVNEQPAATDSVVATNEGTAASGTLSGADPNPGDTLTFSLEQAPEQGTVVIDPDGSFTYTPNAEATGQDTFTYRVTDAQGAFDTGTVAIEIAPVGESEAPKDITGTAGNDVLIGTSRFDELSGGPGDDVLRGGGAPPNLSGRDQLIGGTGDDTLVAEGGIVVLVGGPGNDVLTSIDEGGEFDRVRAEYQNSPAAIIANLTAFTIGGLASGEVADGFGTVDQVSNVHIIADSAHDDVFHVDSSYTNSLGNLLEVRLSAGNDTVTFTDVEVARISYQQAGGPVIVDLEAGTATDVDPADSFIGNDTFSGATSARGSQFDDELYGRETGNDEFRGNGGDDYIDGRGGIDTITFKTSATGIHVDLSHNLVLNDGIFIDALQRHGVDQVYNIQNVRGSSSDDLIVGNAGNNRLFGGAGDDLLRSGGAPQNFFGEDWLDGGAGDDTLIAEGGWVVLEGGAGHDVLTSTGTSDWFDFVRADYRFSPTGIIANLTSGMIGDLGSGQVADGFGSVDVVWNVHVLADSSHNDAIHVDWSYSSGDGNWIEVRLSGGDDTVVFDDVSTARISYAQAEGPVLLDLEAGTATDRNPNNDFIGSDTFEGATQARGSRFGDEIYGRIESGDVLRGSGGDDFIDGRGGSDTIAFNDSLAGIHVDLTQNLVLNDGIFIDALGRFGTDQVVNVENVVGSDWDDLIIGNGGANSLSGNLGDDVIHGGGGNDFLHGGAGQDELFGGAGDDELVSGGASGGFDRLNNTYSFFEQDRLEGGAGNDTLIATGGDVTMLGGAGNDTIRSDDDGSFYFDFTRVSYRTSTAAIVVGMGDFGELIVADGLGGTDSVSRVHVLYDSDHDDMITVDSTYQTSFDNFIEVQLSAGNDTVVFDDVFHARIGYQSAGGAVLVDLELGTATDLNPADNFIGDDTFTGVVTVLRGSQFNDELYGSAGNDRMRGQAGDDFVDGRAGIDTIEFSGSNAGVHVDLSQNQVLSDGHWIDALGRYGTDEVVNFENVNGSAFNDLILGDGGNNQLFGMLGDDELRGGGGNDHLDGGEGADILLGGAGDDYLVSGGATSGFGTNSFVFFERDRLDGGEGNDTLVATGGDVTMVGGAGNDSITSEDNGIGAFDFVAVSYRSSTSGIVVGTGDFVGLVIQDGLGGIDSVSRVHVLHDSAHNDEISIDSTYDTSFGNFIEVRLSGGDDVVTFTDVDQARVSYQGAGGAVLADLALGTATDLNAADNFIGSDSFAGKVHLLRGSHFDDELYGSSGNEAFRGEGGDDTIDGRGGTNTIQFRNDAVWVDLSQNLVLRDGTWIDALGRYGIDEVVNIQNVDGSSFNDVLIGDAGGNQLFGNAGDDILRSGGGSDRLDGGAGDDTLIAEGGDVILVGGGGNDTLIGDPDDSSAFLRADYRSSQAGIVVNLTAVAIAGLVSGQVADGFGTIDHISDIHVIGDSDHDDVVHVDDSYTNSLGNWIEVRLSSGDDAVTFTDVDLARISYHLANGPVVVDLEAGTATDRNVEADDIGNDTFTGANSVRGSFFDDELYGRVNGDDELRGGAGDDYIDGRGGTNLISFDGSESGVHVDLSQSPENRVLDDGNFIESLGRFGTDEVHNVQNVRGSQWDDLIIGDGADNRLEGGAGDDTLAGGFGNDTLIGGSGADRFEYGSPDEGIDSIEGFIVSEDVLVIDVSVFGGGLVAGQGLADNQFVSGDAPQPTEAHGQFLYDDVIGDLYWDGDGSGAQEAVQFANLAGAPGLTASNFELVDSGGGFVGLSEVAAAVDGGNEPVV